MSFLQNRRLNMAYGNAWLKAFFSIVDIFAAELMEYGISDTHRRISMERKIKYLMLYLALHVRTFVIGGNVRDLGISIPMPYQRSRKAYFQ